ncbi:GlxA family transcriptional regulator [Streptomyces ureilyticus]|uniref:Helix-turn-helix domain-containing protein n=1 Tax=Streptomyces ureilyticus TaxID=1775131 RepID=A0ABX0DYD7_9ACTN|nr:helix-turn-helix domain-containing protein [Streptomyces ureilyticus]NGO45519.1 helix-turn-helix domain-containing protein [Streptomyces ureilyticus]
MAMMCKNLAMVVAGRETHRVAVLVRDGVLPMELGLAHQLFGNATSHSGRPLYTLLTCAVTPGMIRTDADFPIYAPHGPEALATADTVIVPSSHEEDEYLKPGGLSAELAEVLDRARGARIASICTGAFVLAAAGLLDGLRATTHWMSTDLFARTFPAVSVDPDVLYVDEDRVLTSAGEAAGIDLCLHMIRRDHGAAIAANVARRTVVPPHREGGQAQYIQRPVPDGQLTDSTTAASRAWALARLADPLTLRKLAARDAMSVRTYSRRFREETGLTPMQWLTQRRVDRARELLEQTDHTVDRIAAEAGFGTAASLRQHFHAALGVSPGAYRATFRGTVVGPGPEGPDSRPGL